MAGIGFSLKKLFKKKGILNLCKAYGYAGVVTTGPLLLGVLLLAGIAFIGRIGGIDNHNRELLNCMLTYSLLASLTVTSWFNMASSRFISDMIYEEKEEKVMPSFYGNVAIMLVICVQTYGTFLHFAGITLLQQILCLWFSLIMVVVWTETLYLTALKDYKAIVLSYTISLLLGFLIAIIFVLTGHASLEALLFSMILSYGILASRYQKLMLDYFPKAEGSCFSFLRWFERYRLLSLNGGFVNIGLFSHIILQYMGGPLAEQVQGLFWGAPEYDVPALWAFFSLLITTVNFVTSVEVEFYPKYANYYGLFNDRGTILDIKQAEVEMRTVLWQELTYAGIKQLFATIMFIILGTPILQTLLGLSSLALSIFRFLCVGYGAYALGNSTMLLLLYFEDYHGAFIGSPLFSGVTTIASFLQIRFGHTAYFGLGFFLGAILFFFFSVARLNWYTKRLPYFLLAQQSFLPKRERGLLVWISETLDNRADRIAEKERERREKEAAALAEQQEGASQS